MFFLLRRPITSIYSVVLSDCSLSQLRWSIALDTIFIHMLFHYTISFDSMTFVALVYKPMSIDLSLMIHYIHLIRLLTIHFTLIGFLVKPISIIKQTKFGLLFVVLVFVCISNFVKPVNDFFGNRGSIWFQNFIGQLEAILLINLDIGEC